MRGPQGVSRDADTTSQVTKRSATITIKIGLARRLLTSLALVACATGCSPQSGDSKPRGDDRRDGALLVYAVNYPLAYFAERIGGGVVEVHMPAPRGIDPAQWSPGADVIAAYQRADLILLNGAGYAAWVNRATLPSSRLVDTSAGFADRYLRVEEAVTHTHGPEGEHEHGDIAFTTWLDPELALIQAAAVRDALIRVRPDAEQSFRAGYDALAADLEAVDDGLRAVFAMLGGQPVLFSHPVYQYLERRYGLNARSLHWEPGQALTANHLDELAGIRETHPAGIIIWEAEPLADTIEKLTARGVTHVVFEPCGGPPADGDYLACMRRNQSTLESLL